MSSDLQNSVQHLVAALDRLEAAIEKRVEEANTDKDIADSAQRQARTAAKHLADANEGLATSIMELRAMLDDANENNKNESEA